VNPKIVIRTERAADEGAIGEVTVAAFAALHVSHHTEQFIVTALRAANALAVSLVAEIDGRVIDLTGLVFAMARHSRRPMRIAA